MISVEKEKCCACGACASVCPKSAIKMAADQYGNYYPRIDPEKCVGCNLCDRVCPYNNLINKEAYCETYAVKLKDTVSYQRSSSGGAAYAAEQSFIEALGGIVYGCGYDEHMIPRHFRNDTIEELSRIQGSKYVRSTVDCYREIVQEANRGKKVMFCGTPCQCEAVKCFARDKSDNIYTLEVICHGVIDQLYWKDYIDLLEKKKNIRISNFIFRCKGKKKPFLASYEGASKSKGRRKKYFTTPALSYYYNQFLRGSIFRENCYKCPYAAMDRKADITVGDYWGYNGNIDSSDGISVMIVNTDKGREIFRLARKLLIVEKKTFDDAARTNEQLLKPFDIDKKHYKLLELWTGNGSDYMEREHRKRHWKAVLASKFGIY